MLELRTLGQLAIHSDESDRANGAATQRKPLALLAYLAAAGSRGASRDRILACFWPESDEERGRQALRQLLYALRRDLRAPDLFHEGTALTINPLVLTSDLSAYRAAVDGQDWETAVRLYRGSFLDGFYLQDAPEFERWAESERLQLAEQHRAALERLAARAADSGDHRSAVQWWRRLAEDDPLNSRVTMRLMEELAAAGELERAIECGRAHASRLTNDLGTGPDPEVARLAESLRAVRPAARLVPTEPVRPVPVQSNEPDARALVANPSRLRTVGVRVGALSLGLLAAGLGLGLYRGGPNVTVATAATPRVVAVLPFEDQSPASEDRYFGRSLPEELARQLAQVASLRVIGPGATRAYRDSTDGLDKLTRSTRADGVVEGTVRVAEGRLTITVRLVQAGTSRTLWSQRYSRGLSDVFAVRSEMTRGIATALGASITPADTRRLALVPTTDIGAYELYLRSTALSHVNRAENLAGISLLQQAMSRDSGFAFGLAMLARRYLFHALLVDSTYGDSGFAAARRALALQPDLGTAHFALGDLLGMAGRPSAARLEYLRAIDLDPSELPAMVDLSDADLTLGRYDEALYWALRAVRASPTSTGFYAHAGMALYSLGVDEVTERWLVSAERRWPDYERFTIDRALLDYVRGRDSAAVDRLRHYVARHPGNEEAAVALAGFAALAGTDDAESLVAERLRVSPVGAAYGPAPESFRTLLALLRRRAGDGAGARVLEDTALAAAHALAKSDREDSAFSTELAALYALRGQHAAALGWLERAYHAGYKNYRFLRRDPCFAGLREQASFRALLARMEADVAAMRRRAVEANDSLFRIPSTEPRR